MSKHQNNAVTCAKTGDPKLIAALREESERTKVDPYPAGTRVRRPSSP
ncbi:hypothetical protein MWU75_08695 [Ornithinimicrobium sp. F0845]|nr:hypothetical protein [Ornithinimicrobium sp. F0845]MCK0112213.1 hypothetical protein [Ornithinimicrobium sp. F0845]